METTRLVTVTKTVLIPVEHVVQANRRENGREGIATHKYQWIGLWRYLCPWTVWWRFWYPWKDWSLSLFLSSALWSVKCQWRKCCAMRCINVNAD